jgi:hypothetical protein
MLMQGRQEDWDTKQHTLEGRKAVMTSLTFCVEAAAGGGGAPGVADPVAIMLLRWLESTLFELVLVVDHAFAVNSR